jgi:hypothetical protein
MLDRIEDADPEARLLIMLSAQAVLRGDYAMLPRLRAFREMPPGEETPEGTPPVDGLEGSLARIKTVCGFDEAEDWGRLLAITLLGGDQARLDALLELMGRRCAN